ncbi:MAG: hypothetical protein L6V93_09045 [Clostridiales bacterium]|nr:MAG: hypothetical protein L6V93_09045 [Clostridiales bacterium]
MRERKRKKRRCSDLGTRPSRHLRKAASATDCTGLIQISPIDENEIEAYKDVYDFGPSPDDYID